MSGDDGQMCGFTGAVGEFAVAFTRVSGEGDGGRGGRGGREGADEMEEDRRPSESIGSSVFSQHESNCIKVIHETATLSRLFWMLFGQFSDPFMTLS